MRVGALIGEGYVGFLSALRLRIFNIKGKAFDTY